MYNTILQFTRFQNITGGKVDKESTTYGYRLYNVEETAYCNVYSSLEELEDDINTDTVYICCFICYSEDEKIIK